jgi:hypothetical protein
VPPNELEILPAPAAPMLGGPAAMIIAAPLWTEGRHITM